MKPKPCLPLLSAAYPPWLSPWELREKLGTGVFESVFLGKKASGDSSGASSLTCPCVLLVLRLPPLGPNLSQQLYHSVKRTYGGAAFERDTGELSFLWSFLLVYETRHTHYPIYPSPPTHSSSSGPHRSPSRTSPPLDPNEHPETTLTNQDLGTPQAPTYQLWILKPPPACPATFEMTRNRPCPGSLSRGWLSEDTD